VIGCVRSCVNGIAGDRLVDTVDRALYVRIRHAFCLCAIASNDRSINGRVIALPDRCNAHTVTNIVPRSFPRIGELRAQKFNKLSDLRIV
jgi:hypothetical protein